MKKEGKRITRWKTGTTKLQGAAYLREMAENGWILEDMNHLTYSFREDEPQYLTYRLMERGSYLTEEERAEYEKNGWQEVCHYEREYVFVRERDPFAENTEEQKEEIIKDLERRIELEETTERRTRHGQLLVLVSLFAAIFLISGFSQGSLMLGLRMVVRFLPWILLAYFASRKRTKGLRQEQERVREGDISDEYTDWRKSRRVTVGLVLVLVLGMGAWVYYTSGFNEKTFDMPKEVSYEEIPAVRLENLIDEPLERTGERLNPKLEGIQLNTDVHERTIYEAMKKMGSVENYGVDHRYLLKTKEKVETHQCMKTEDGTEYTLDTMYCQFRGGGAPAYYSDVVIGEEKSDKKWAEEGIEMPKRQLVFVETDAFARRHTCKREWAEGTVYHIICQGEDSQIMELDFYYDNGDVTVEQLMDEIAKVFDAQAK